MTATRRPRGDGTAYLDSRSRCPAASSSPWSVSASTATTSPRRLGPGPTPCWAAGRPGPRPSWSTTRSSRWAGWPGTCSTGWTCGWLALTGSQGKTGTKDYLAQVLATAGPTVATSGNNNNELGVPLTVLRAEPGTEFLVVEMGARGIGHIGYLCDIAPPERRRRDQRGHRAPRRVRQPRGDRGRQGRDRRGPAGGRHGRPQRRRRPDRGDGRPDPGAGADLRTAGDVSWRGLELDDLGRPSFELGHAGEWHPVRLGQVGAHQVENAAAAAAMAIALGLAPSRVATALSAAESVSRWRMETRERADGLIVVNDAYNANPASMAAALDALVAIGRRRERRTVAVLGEMKELGDGALEAHRVSAGRPPTSASTCVVVVGEAARGIAEGATGTPGWTGEAILTAGRDEARDWVRENVAAADVVLVKASRGAALEVIAEGLLEGEGTLP